MKLYGFPFNLEHNQRIELKFQVGRKLKPVTITKRGDRLWLKFRYNETLLKEVKSNFSGRKWCPDSKQWHVKDCQHNWFQIAYLCRHMVEDPYTWFDTPLKDVTIKNHNLYGHQKHGVQFILTRHYCQLAHEMGSGKTLTLITAMQLSGITDWLWVGPKSALTAVKLEFKKWNSRIKPTFCTYSSLKKYVENWPDGKRIHPGVVFDESSRIKNETALRSQAAKYIADSIRNEWGYDGYVILLSGSPAPRSPADWWHQCEVAWPGFLKEGNQISIKERLAICEDMESPITGGKFRHLISWRDNEAKCDVCGQPRDGDNHDPTAVVEEWGHHFKPSRNEVANLYSRMKGLVDVKLKKDCLDLPEKQYQIIKCEVSPATMRLARLAIKQGVSAVKQLILLRELSDGFQYVETVEGTETCERCQGTKSVFEWEYTGLDEPEEIIDYESDPNWRQQKIACPRCRGTGHQERIVRETKFVECPKEQALKDLLDSHDDIGRLVIYGGFTGSIDRIVKICEDANWSFIRVDGRGWFSDLTSSSEELLETFQSDNGQRIAFIGQPAAAGMGLTLTASPSIVYYSNDFNAESRIQSEDRIHRPGCKGANIYDIIHLPTDEIVLKNLRRKRELQSITMGELEEAFLIEGAERLLV